MKIAVFGHDASDAMLTRRFAAFADLHHEVMGFTMRRGEDAPRPWHNRDLGRTHDAAFLHRLWAIFRGIQKTGAHDFLKEADLFWARNLDMLMVALVARARAKSDAPVIYECLDIHHRLLGKGLISQTLRRLERKLLKEVRGIVISSPAFEAEYFDKMHPDHPRALLLENKLPLRRLPPRPARKQSCDQHLTLGWVGILRCQRSLNILMEVAEAMRGGVKVKLHGKPALTAIPHFHDLVEETENLTYEGPYQSPDDLDDIYGRLDLIWAGDYYQAGGNSEWLLPNRLYEGGYFGVPALAPAGTQTAQWITAHGTGHVIEGEPETSLIPFLSTLIAKNELNALQQKVLSAPTSVFAEDHSALDDIIKGVLS